MKLLFKSIRIFILFLCLPIMLLSAEPEKSFNTAYFSQTPVLQGGRIKPLDSIARNALLFIQGKQSVKTKEGKEISPIEWFLWINSYPEKTDDWPQFLIENPGLFSFAGKNKQKYRVSYNFLKTHFDMIFTQAERASELEPENRTPFEKEVLTLKNRIWLYTQLKNSIKLENTSSFTNEITHYKTILPKGINALHNSSKTLSKSDNSSLQVLNLYFKRYQELHELSYFSIIPPDKDYGQTEWLSMGEGLLFGLKDDGHYLNPRITQLALIIDAYRNHKHDAFLSASKAYITAFKLENTKQFRRVKGEAWFNKHALFYKSILCFSFVILLLIGYWLFSIKKAYLLSNLAFIIGMSLLTVGILFRMWISGRPPVTNLYSSAIFVGLIAVILALFLERMYKSGLSLLMGSIVAILTLIIAHHLSIQGDTLEMMQAVLDSNFWLATHVIIITAGYGAVLLAGAFANVYILRGFLTTTLRPIAARKITSMVYGLQCLGLLLSFIGTVLGGIWADQSWGRFWGWDPKENGALLIVLWVAIILHAKIAGYIKERGLMIMSIFGGIVVSFSWWGVNMLGIGLHAYGFMEKGFLWLATFMIIQLLVMVIGLIPLNIWASYRD